MTLYEAQEIVDGWFAHRAVNGLTLPWQRYDEFVRVLLQEEEDQDGLSSEVSSY